VPGYEPFLLCDFHIHTRWSDGRLSIREVVDLYGRTERFDVIAITDHILMARDLLARVGRLASLGYRQFSVTPDRFQAYLEEIDTEARRAKRLYGLLVIPGAEITQNHSQQEEFTHHRAEPHGVHQRRPAGRRDPEGDMSTGRAQHRVSSTSSNHPAGRDRNVLSMGPSQATGGPRGRVGSGQS
jgi:hypothetical protein